MELGIEKDIVVNGKQYNAKIVSCEVLKFDIEYIVEITNCSDSEEMYCAAVSNPIEKDEEDRVIHNYILVIKKAVGILQLNPEPTPANKRALQKLAYWNGNCDVN